MLLMRPENHLNRFWDMTNQNQPLIKHRPALDLSQIHTATADTSRSMEAAAYSEVFQLEIVTREGDHIRVDVRQMVAGLSVQESRFAGHTAPKRVTVLASHGQLDAGAFEARFGLHVQGDLNEDEMAALTRIFDQVGRLADQFFHGDIQAAVRSAQQLRVDSSQIGKLGLDITQQFTQMSYRHQAAAAYMEVSKTQAGPNPIKAAMQVDHYWTQVEQVQATIQQTFRSFSLNIETLMGGGEHRSVSTIEEIHQQIKEMVGELRTMLGLPADAKTDEMRAGKHPRPDQTAETQDVAVAATKADQVDGEDLARGVKAEDTERQIKVEA